MRFFNYTWVCFVAEVVSSTRLGQNAPYHRVWHLKTDDGLAVDAYVRGSEEAGVTKSIKLCGEKLPSGRVRAEFTGCALSSTKPGLLVIDSVMVQEIGTDDRSLRYVAENRGMTVAELLASLRRDYEKELK